MNIKNINLYTDRRKHFNISDGTALPPVHHKRKCFCGDSLVSFFPIWSVLARLAVRLNLQINLIKYILNV